MFFTDTEKIKQAFYNDEIVKFDKEVLILGSASASRFKIMKNAGLKFLVIPSLVNEELLKTEFGKVESEAQAIEYVKKLSLEKAMWLAKRCKNAVILAADTVAFYKNEILEKPKNEVDARRIFSALSNSTHIAITGVSIIDDNHIENFAKVSPVKMLNISKELQDVLVKDKLTYTYAGGYCVDGKLGNKVIVLKEDFNNVMGLPIEDIVEKFKEAGYDFSE